MAVAFPTQVDVARLSKVSRSTVAGILRGDPDNSAFAPDTRRRVMEAVRRLNYRPNSAAGALRSGQTHTIAFTIPNFSAVHTDLQTQKLRGIGQRAQELGYALTLSGYEEHSNLRTTFRRLVREGRFDGVVFHGYIDRQEDEREAIFAEMGVPYVVLEKSAIDSTCVDFDSTEGGRLATEHLLERGKRKIAFIGDSEKAIPFRQRREGYQAALREAGIQTKDELILPLSPGKLAETGRAGMRKLIDTDAKFDAVFCITDDTSLGAMQTLTAAGRSIGGGANQVAVVGYDDSPMAQLATPPLTSVLQDGMTMGQMAMDLLHESVRAHRAGESVQTRRHVIAPQLVVRESSAADKQQQINIKQPYGNNIDVL